MDFSTIFSRTKHYSVVNRNTGKDQFLFRAPSPEKEEIKKAVDKSFFIPKCWG
jgi:hypothetical protein